MVKGINHNSNGKQKRLQMLVGSIRSKLEELGNGSPENKLLIEKIDNIDIKKTDEKLIVCISISGTYLRDMKKRLIAEIPTKPLKK